MNKCYFAELAGDEVCSWNGRLRDLPDHLINCHNITSYLTNLEATVSMSLTLGIEEFGLRFVVLKFPHDGETVKQCAILFEEYYDEESRTFNFVLRSVNNARFRYTMIISGENASYTYKGRTLTFNDPPVTSGKCGLAIYDK